MEVNQSAVNFKKNSAYTVKLKELEFEGPLDLLLFLVKKAEIDINDISISEITSQYLSYLSLLMDMDLDNISEFIEMAATLIYIKSRSLIPVEHDYEEDEQDPRDELIQRLLEYQKYKFQAFASPSRSRFEHFFLPFVRSLSVVRGGVFDIFVIETKTS
ncbi:MAG: segregation/condensation protein A, partial [Spirochaetales bacterium]|nr:segregation/condensation protein A [Spirochaetales bacterium]